MVLDTPIISTLVAALVILGIGYTIGTILDYMTQKVRERKASREIDEPTICRESF